jgi:geranylgeranyl diphosphate synthase type I
MTTHGSGTPVTSSCWTGPANDGGSGVAALDVVSSQVTSLLDSFLESRVADLVKLDPELELICGEIAGLVQANGKRLRPAFVYWGYRATSAEHDESVLWPAAAVELLHTFALIHDDVMDRSPMRRGRPAVHESLAAAHRTEGLLGNSTWFGISGAILAGDLAFVWADQLMDSADLDRAALDRARRVFTDLRVEVMAGQYLDLQLASFPRASEDDALRVALLKSGRYTVTRPLQLGAAIGGSDELLDAALCAFGDAIGLAFQLRDDVLGLFGDPSVTGKGAKSDLREGKRTVLMIRALELAGPSERKVLSRVLGHADLDERDLSSAQQIIVDCGALDSVEQLLARQHELACRALAPIPDPARQALHDLADLAAYRLA